MSETDKLMAFGRWLHARIDQQKEELVSLSINRNHSLDAIRIKAGHIENSVGILKAFMDLYRSDINKFMQEYLGQEPEAEEKESTDDSNAE